MTFQIRQLSTADYPFVISVIDQWWGGRQMAERHEIAGTDVDLIRIQRHIELRLNRFGFAHLFAG